MKKSLINIKLLKKINYTDIYSYLYSKWRKKNIPKYKTNIKIKKKEMLKKILLKNHIDIIIFIVYNMKFLEDVIIEIIWLWISQIISKNVLFVQQVN